VEGEENGEEPVRRVPEALEEPYQLFLQAFMSRQAMSEERAQGVVDKIAGLYESCM
jgi:hypothetical protein